MSDQIDASEVVDKTGKPIIDPENNKKTPQQGAGVCDESSNLTAWAVSIAKTATSPARFLVTTARNYMVCGRVQPILLPRGDCGSSARS